MVPEDFRMLALFVSSLGENNTGTEKTYNVYICIGLERAGEIRSFPPIFLRPLRGIGGLVMGVIILTVSKAGGRHGSDDTGFQDEDATPR